MPQTAKIHWTQRPENKDKLKLLGKNAHKDKVSKSIIGEWESLKIRIEERSKEIDQTMKDLAEEREKIAKLLEGYPPNISRD